MKILAKRILTLSGIIVFAAALICVVSASCSTDAGGGGGSTVQIPSDLQGTTWECVGLPDAFTPPADARVQRGNQLSFTDKTVTYTRVNQSPYTYTISGTRQDDGAIYLDFGGQFTVSYYTSGRTIKIHAIYFQAWWYYGKWEEVASGNPSAITYTVTQTGGAEGTADSTGIVFTFSASVDSLNLTAADITVGGAASKGTATLTGSGRSRTLSPITVNEVGTATVSIAKTSIEAATKSVTVYKAGQTAPEYWSITWYLNDGAEGTGEYPAQIEKGAVLAKPSPDPTKADNVFDGWYTDSALTQAYNFANPVTANLYLYAKWGQPPVEPPGPNSTLAEKLAWVLNENNVADGQTYTFEVSADENLSYQWLSYTNKSAITIILKSSGGEKIISLSQKGSLFSIVSGVTLVLDRNITLKGLSDNYGPLVRVYDSGELIMNAGAKITGNNGGGVLVNGTFTMNGGEITGNTADRTNNATDYLYSVSSYGGGVSVYADGTFTMNGGEITGNTSSSFTAAQTTSYSYGGGVYVSSGGTFTMNNGKISENKTDSSDERNVASGGGVCVDGTFIMKGGEISDNVVSPSRSFQFIALRSSQGGGVSVGQQGTFTMSNGKISGNITYPSQSSGDSCGGGVYVEGTFTMSSGEISGNIAHSSSYVGSSIARSYGGGVYVSGGTFTKSGGTIYGYNIDDPNSNKVTWVMIAVGSVVFDNRGHAVCVSTNSYQTDIVKRRETTAGPTVNLDSTKDGVAGGWEN